MTGKSLYALGLECHKCNLRSLSYVTVVGQASIAKS